MLKWLSRHHMHHKIICICEGYVCVYIHTHLCNVHKYSLRRSSQTAWVPVICKLPFKKIKKPSSCCLCTGNHISGGCFSSTMAICVFEFLPQICVCFIISALLYTLKINQPYKLLCEIKWNVQMWFVWVFACSTHVHLSKCTATAQLNIEFINFIKHTEPRIVYPANSIENNY